MNYRQLGDTGLFVSELCLGTMNFGGSGMWEILGTLSQAECNKFVGHALEAGVNFFDTANMYGAGESEVALGKALGASRKDVIIATKVKARMGPGPNEVGLSRVHVMHEVEASLKRLGTDYIDLYQIHDFDPLTSLEDILRSLDDVVRSGKVRYIGCSNLAAWQLMKSLAISRREHLEPFKTVQAYYSIAGRELEREVIPFVKDQNLGLLIWSPLAGGFLSGKFTRDGTRDQRARRSKIDLPPVDKERAYDIIEVMQVMAKARGVSVAQIALAWLLHQGAVTSIIIGVRRFEQLDDNLN